MEHKHKKAVLKKLRKDVTALKILLLVYLLVLIPGCDDILQTEPPEIKDTNLSVSWSQALQIIQDALIDTDPLVRARAIEVVASTGQLKLMPQVQRLMQERRLGLSCRYVLKIDTGRRQTGFGQAARPILSFTAPGLRANILARDPIARPGGSARSELGYSV